MPFLPSHDDPPAVGTLHSSKPVLRSPFFGYTLETPLFKKDDREVAQILELPLEAFLRSQITRAEIPIDSLTTLTVPVYEWQGHRIWGATAMMMSELQVLLKQVI